MRLLFVCLGNICRSPTAEGVMRELVRREGMEDELELESAGTGAWHVGSPPDARAAQAARSRGFELSGLARRVEREDFESFDLILAMDTSNLRDLRRLARDEDQREKVRLLREFDPAGAGTGDGDGDLAGAGAGAGPAAADLDVPDPYYGARGGFDEVFDIVHAACEGLLAQIRAGRLA